MFSKSKFFLLYGGTVALLCVALGAFGAHALKDQLASTGHTETWKTAMQYGFIHALTMLLIASQYASMIATTALRWALRFWALGILLFSGSLVGLSLELGSWLGPITPLGGLSFMMGWTCFLVAVAKMPKP